MQSISSLTYPKILRRASRGILVVLLACMPWATLSPAASPPSQWAALRTTPPSPDPDPTSPIRP
ncbi:hypothetical protein [Desulfotignum phosphitoxidans]|uniref:hypothetical protein n=1 Tax=Desulfotignum phosphitoxidans TaxID=190898 RepID=UPI000346AA7D|nr:hypothetical protein [Desulfotignum phosphitoxidans]